MIYTDKYGFLTNETLDGADSAFRCGMFNIFFEKCPLSEFSKINPVHYYFGKALLVRHPYHFPSNNPNNFTRDQLIPLVGGMRGPFLNEEVRDIFFAHAKRFFFCQNSERDIPGSKKYPWPHWFFKDSNPNSIIESRLFDFRDFLAPDDIFYLILCARIKWLYILGIFCVPFIIMQIILCSSKVDTEINQLLCKIKVYSEELNTTIFKKLMNVFMPKWERQTRFYWERRNEKEYAEAIIRNLKLKQ